MPEGKKTEKPQKSTGSGRRTPKGSGQRSQGKKTSGDNRTRSAQPKSALQRKPTTTYVRNLKGTRPIVALTAYDAPMAKWVSDAGVDFLLVGDSVGTTQLGFETTVPVTLDTMVHHTSAVRRGNPECLIVADLPFGEASMSMDRLVASCRRLMQEGGADAVKLEGGKDIADDVEKLIATGIPVLGHVGLLPQTVKTIGGYRKFAAERKEAEEIFTDAMALEEAGCFAIVAEMIQEKVAAHLAKHLSPPLIGIGSGKGCDGQILVTPDLLGMHSGPAPGFVKPYADFSRLARNALEKFVQDVRRGNYPSS